ncbi:hypothetical protein [Halobacterium bonnevillei]|uniref:Uncharacterized protein n=1 Tax=Halobacterium bonnevillei TaxID=2692200 RepID=A0A6B0SEQ8_9EURY|nr:hypothetical protein [Halobacterium bonnevillei]MXR20028.1 hypothetical protein [Halobacterium bonnevillei]
MSPTITFGQSAAETIAGELGVTVTKDGYLLDENDEVIIPSGDDEPLTIEEFGGTGVGSRVFIKDNFNSVSEYVEEYRSEE